MGRLEIPEPWRGIIDAADDDRLPRAQVDEVNAKLRVSGADHPYVPKLLTVPGIGWVSPCAEIAAEIGEINRFESATKLTGYTGLCPRVVQSGESDRRGPLSKQGPRYLRWALLEATMHALRHPAYSERYQRDERQLGERAQRVAQIDIARRLTVAIWGVLARTPFAPGGAALRMAASTTPWTCAPERTSNPPGPPSEAIRHERCSKPPEPREDLDPNTDRYLTAGPSS